MKNNYNDPHQLRAINDSLERADNKGAVTIEDSPMATKLNKIEDMLAE